MGADQVQTLEGGDKRSRCDRASKRCLDTPAFPRPRLESAKGSILDQGCDGVVWKSYWEQISIDSSRR